MQLWYLSYLVYFPYNGKWYRMHDLQFHSMGKCKYYSLSCVLHQDDIWVQDQHLDLNDNNQIMKVFVCRVHEISIGRIFNRLWQNQLLHREFLKQDKFISNCYNYNWLFIGLMPLITVLANCVQMFSSMLHCSSSGLMLLVGSVVVPSATPAVTARYPHMKHQTIHNCRLVLHPTAIRKAN
jgi:hypothetical protein